MRTRVERGRGRLAELEAQALGISVDETLSGDDYMEHPVAMLWAPLGKAAISSRTNSLEARTFNLRRSCER